jgi:two-component system response regulator CpxR
MHPAARGVTAGGKAIDLTSTEFSILETLMRHPGEVVSKEQLSMGGLGRPLGRFDRSIDMHLSNLRRKLGPLPDNSNRIETVRGIGYLLKSP